MNKPCLKCGKIMLVPDIPLPSTYKQKCTKCGFQNPVGDELFFDSSDQDRGIDVFDLSNSTTDKDTDQLDLSQGIDRSNADKWMAQLSTQAPPAMDPQPPMNTGVSRGEVDRLLNQFRDDLLQDIRAELNLRVSESEARIQGQLASKTAESPKPKTIPDEPKDSSSGEFVAEKEVLVCTQNGTILRACESSFAGLGYRLQPASSYQDARQRIQQYAYQVILFDQRFIQGSPEGQTALTSIHKIALPIRRHQVVVLITPGIESGESQVFYQWGVDLNVHPDDIAEVGAMTQEVIKIKQTLLQSYLSSDLDTDRIMT